MRWTEVESSGRGGAHDDDLFRVVTEGRGSVVGHDFGKGERRKKRVPVGGQLDELKEQRIWLVAQWFVFLT